jgi:hypothetical protein
MMKIKNSNQVTSVCHCITRNGQMYVVHIGCNDCRGCGTMGVRTGRTWTIKLPQGCQGWCSHALAATADGRLLLFTTEEWKFPECLGLPRVPNIGHSGKELFPECCTRGRNALGEESLPRVPNST